MGGVKSHIFTRINLLCFLNGELESPHVIGGDPTHFIQFE